MRPNVRGPVFQAQHRHFDDNLRPIMEAYQPALGDKVQLRKRHPCGSDVWTVVRTGADIGLVCTGCGRRVLLDRPLFRKRVKKLLESAPNDAE